MTPIRPTTSSTPDLGDADPANDILNAANACHECHPGLADYNRLANADYDGDGVREGIQDETRGLFDILRAGILATMPGTSVAGSGRIDITASGFGNLTDLQKFALYNYNFVWSDGSFGNHNTAYAIQLLQRSYYGVHGRSINQDFPAIRLRGPVDPFPRTQNLDANNGGWSFLGVLGGPPTGQYANGALNITSLSNADFGFWTSPPGEIPTYLDSIYRGIFTIASNVTVLAQVPQIRLRASSQNLQYSTALILQSQPPGTVMPGVTPKNYDFLFTPPPTAAAGAGIQLSFDLVNFDPADASTATVSLNGYILRRGFQDGIRAGMTSLTAYDFEADANGWAFMGVLGGPPTGVWENGALNIDFLTNTGDFGFWQSPAGPAIVGSRFYALDFTLSSDVPSRALVPDLRLRMADATGQWTSYIQIISETGGGASPGATPEVHTLYLFPHSVLVNRALNFAFDGINFNPADAATGRVRLESLGVLSGPVSLLP